MVRGHYGTGACLAWNLGLSPSYTGWPGNGDRIGKRAILCEKINKKCRITFSRRALRSRENGI